MPDEETFFLQSDHMFEIQTGEGEDSYARLGAGLSDVDPQGNDEIDQTPYLDGSGFASSDVTGGQVTLAFSGHRLHGDPAQDYIYSKAYSYGKARRTNFRWTQPDGSVLEGDATIANITGPSGAANGKGEIGFEIHFNGKPEFTPAGDEAGTQSTQTMQTTIQKDEKEKVKQ